MNLFRRLPAQRSCARRASVASSSVERLEDRRLLSVSLSGATNLGTLNGRKSFTDSLTASTNTQDLRKFTMSAAGTFTASLTGLTANADIQLIKDANNNGVVDTGETVASS